MQIKGIKRTSKILSDGRKLILSLFAGRKKRKAWNKTREKYMLVKRRQIETDR